MRGYAPVLRSVVLVGVLSVMAMTAVGSRSSAAPGQSRSVITDLGTLGRTSIGASDVDSDGGSILITVKRQGVNDNPYLWKVVLTQPPSLRRVGRLVYGSWPSWSPNGSQIAYEWGGVWIASADGTRTRPLKSAAGGQPDWSPDGRRIAYVCQIVSDFSGVLCVVDVATGHSTVLARVRKGVVAAPAWAPNGHAIVYVARIEHAATVPRSPLRRDGSLVVVADGRAPRVIAQETSERAYDSPRWSPDGKQIAFLSRSGDQCAIAVMAATGGTPNTVTDLPCSTFWAGKWKPFPPPGIAWSATGDQLAYSAGDSLRFVRLDGTLVRTIRTPPIIGQIDWGP